MTDIQKSIRLFNEALPIAWAKLEGMSLGERSQMAMRLSQLVRTSIRAGLEDPEAIASAAIEGIKQK